MATAWKSIMQSVDPIENFLGSKPIVSYIFLNGFKMLKKPLNMNLCINCFPSSNELISP